MATLTSAKPATGARRRRITFSLTAPDATAVSVAGTFCDWDNSTYPLKKDGTGNWKRIVTLAPGRYEYRFVVDDVWMTDPDCAERTANPFGEENCVLNVS